MTVLDLTVLLLWHIVTNIFVHIKSLYQDIQCMMIVDCSGMFGIYGDGTEPRPTLAANAEL